MHAVSQVVSKITLGIGQAMLIVSSHQKNWNGVGFII